jgi:hypothetical protein
MAEEFNIFVYSSFASDKPDHQFVCKGSRQVVGLMKTIMDNFKPAHVDIMSKDKFYEVKQDE